MCGITAFSGKEEALPFLLQGLSRLEYRGYDSAGVTLVDKDKLFTVKTKGRLQNLIERRDQAKPRGCAVSYTHLTEQLMKFIRYLCSFICWYITVILGIYHFHFS